MASCMLSATRSLYAISHWFYVFYVKLAPGTLYVISDCLGNGIDFLNSVFSNDKKLSS